MGTRLLISALTKYLAGLVLVAALLFIPAGTFGYWNGWLFIGLLFVPMLILVKRIRNEEKVLAEGLAGYTEYMKKVKWRILPFVW